MIEKLRKIYELSIRGADGERQLAASRLQELLSNHKLTLADILDTARNITPFQYKGDLEFLLLSQIVMTVTNSYKLSAYDYRKSGRRVRNKIGYGLTKAEAVEVRQLFDYYRQEFQKEQKHFLGAFIVKNNLLPDTGHHKKDFSEEEKQEILRISELAQALQALPTPRKQLSAKSIGGESTCPQK